MLYHKGPISYFRSGKHLKWVKTPDGRTIEHPHKFSVSRVFVPKHSLLWGILLCLLTLAGGSYIYSREKVKLANWLKTEAEVVSSSSFRHRSNTGAPRSKTRYQAVLRFTTASGGVQEVTGPPEKMPSREGQKRIIYYDPKQPTSFTLSSPNPDFGWRIALGLAAVFFLLGTAGHIYGPVNRLSITINDENWVYLDGKLVENPRS